MCKQPVKVYAHGKAAEGKLSLAGEVLACVTLAVLLTWYYIIVIMSLIMLYLVVASPGLRPYAATGLIVFWSTAVWPVDVKPWEWFCKSALLRLWRDYFYYEYVLEEDIHDPTKRYMLVQCPHGVFPFCQVLGVAALIETNHTGSNLNGVAASVLFSLPGFRQLFSWIGCRPALRENLASNLKCGGTCGLVPGGIAEMFLVDSAKERLYLRHRYGFVREAIRNGAHLVPVFCFGNSATLKLMGEKTAFLPILKTLSRKLQMAIMFFYGRWGLLVPFRVRLKSVLGKPLPVEQKDNPTDEEIKALHDLFIRRIAELYENHRPEWETRPLSIE